MLLLDPQAPAGQRLKVLLRGLDLPHGLAVGIDRRIYVGVVDRIFRFDPLSPDPAASVETIIQGLPGLQPVLADGTKLKHNSHPLKHFVFDAAGRLFVNIGAPSDACAASAQETKPCAAGEGPSPFAAVWMFTPPPGGVFPPLRAGEAGPKHEVFARGLRNSMALAVHPRSGRAAAGRERARHPRREGAERGNQCAGAGQALWLAVLPRSRDARRRVCDVSQEQPDPTAISATMRRCTGQPHSVMPPHGAPLGMLYYAGEKFPALKDKLIVSLHGYRPAGSRVLVYDTDARGCADR